MSRLEITWPDEAVERVRAAEERLRLASTELRARSFEDRLRAVASVLGDWTTPDSPWRRELAETLTAASSFSSGTLREGLDSGLRAWDPDAFVACAREEIGSLLARGTRELVPYEWTAVLAGGTIPMPTILSGLLPLVLGSPVLLRETSKDPVTARLLARSIEARDEGLARAFESVAFPADDTAALEVVLRAPCVVATGSDETLASIRSRLRPSQRFVGYGHRFSIAIVGPALSGGEPVPAGSGGLSAREKVAAGIALDVARWDQSGCLSPVAVYLLDVPHDEARAFAAEIARALDEIADVMPRGALRTAQSASIANERAEARMRASEKGVMLFEGAEHTVILEIDASPRPAPLGRFLRIMPVEGLSGLNSALFPLAEHLSNASLDGINSEIVANKHSTTEDRDAPIDAISTCLARLGVSRVTESGRLQTPPVDWPHDGRPLLIPLARFTSSDSAQA